MEEEKFDGMAMREALTPKLTRAEMARKMGVSWTFLEKLETGETRWPAQRRAKFIEIVEAWKVAPSPTPKKPRKDIGKRHRRFKLKGPRKPRIWRPKPKTAQVIQGVPVPVPHSHGEITGIG